jgi:hypothetical protein
VGLIETSNAKFVKGGGSARSARETLKKPGNQCGCRSATNCLPTSRTHALSAVPEDGNSNREQRVSEADALAKALDLELTLKRASWERARAKHNRWRLLSIFFVLLVLLAALFAFFFVLPQIRSRGAVRANATVEASR